MFERWGLFAYRHRRIVPLVLVGIIAVLYAVFGVKLAERLSTEGWDDPNSASTRAQQIETETFGRDITGDVVWLVHAPEGKTTDDVASQVTSRLAELKEKYPDQIAAVTPFENQKAMATEDKSLAFALIGIQGEGKEVLKNYREIKDQFQLEGVTTELVGTEPVADALDNGMAHDMHRAEVLGLPLVGVLLLVVFGSVVAALMPLLVGVLSIVGSLGILSILAELTTVNTFAQSVVTLLGLGLAIDYGLFMVSRFREELSEGATVPEAVATTTATAGKTVVTSALMVAVALSGLLLFPQAFLKSVAYGAMSAVGLAALLSITVLPSVFGLLGPRINWLPVRRSAARRGRSATMDSWSGRVPGWAMRHPKVLTVGIVAVLLGLTFPLTGIKFGGINETYLPPDNQVRQAQAVFNENFPDFRTDPIKLVIVGANNSQLAPIYREANSVEGLTGRFAPSHPTKDGVTVLSTGITSRDLYPQVVEELESITPPEGVKIYVGGTPAMEQESIRALFDKLPWMFGYIIAVTFILMSLAFGSVFLPAKAIIMTILGMGTTLGILTLMFVDGVGADVLQFSAGPLMSPVVVLIMAIIYGLSTDYEVFLLSRMIEDRQNGASTPHAIRFGTATTGGIITAAALIMIVVCGVFGFSEIVMMKYIAFGMIAALLLDATVIRMVLVPAVMFLLREDCWWGPRWLKRLSAKLGHNESGSAPKDDSLPFGELMDRVNRRREDSVGGAPRV